MTASAGNCTQCGGSLAHHHGGSPAGTCWCGPCLGKAPGDRCTAFVPQPPMPPKPPIVEDAMSNNTPDSPAKPKEGTLRREVYDAIAASGARGTTDADVAAALEKAPNSISRARKTLADDGLIESVPAPEEEGAKKGPARKYWVVTDEADRAADPQVDSAKDDAVAGDPLFEVTDPAGNSDEEPAGDDDALPPSSEPEGDGEDDGAADAEGVEAEATADDGDGDGAEAGTADGDADPAPQEAPGTEDVEDEEHVVVTPTDDGATIRDGHRVVVAHGGTEPRVEIIAHGVTVTLPCGEERREALEVLVNPFSFPEEVQDVLESVYDAAHQATARLIGDVNDHPW